MSDFKFPTETKALHAWYCEEEYFDAGFEEVEESAEPGKHDASDIQAILKHTASGRFVEVSFSRSYSYGVDDYSFSASEVFPHVVTTTVYKGKPA